MFLQRTVQVGKASAATHVLMLGFIPAGFCQAVPDNDEALPAPDKIEEIVVYGEKSMTRLRLDLNSKKEFNVECDHIVPIDTRRREHVCTPVFAIQIQQQAAQDMIAQNMQNPIASLGAILKKKEKLMWKEMAELVAQSPEMKAAHLKLVEANRNMETDRQRRCQDRGVMCRN